MKKVLKHYVTYGKGSGAELWDLEIVENTKEAIEALLEDLYIHVGEDMTYGYEDFLAGKSNSFEYYRDGGDWDDPTGGYIVLQTKEEALKELTDNYNRDVEKLESLFR